MTRTKLEYKVKETFKGIHMALTEAFMTADELAGMTPEEFVNQIRHECMKPGRGMHDHPLVLGIEAGTVTVPHFRSSQNSFISISRRCFHGSALFMFVAPMRMSGPLWLRT